MPLMSSTCPFKFVSTVCRSAPVLLLALFTLCSCAKLIDLLLSARLEIPFINSKISRQRDFLQERSLARRNCGGGVETEPPLPGCARGFDELTQKVLKFPRTRSHVDDGFFLNFIFSS